MRRYVHTFMLSMAGRGVARCGDLMSQIAQPPAKAQEGLGKTDPQVSSVDTEEPNCAKSSSTSAHGWLFPSVPMQVYFDMQFTPVNGQWKLLDIGVEVGPAESYRVIYSGREISFGFRISREKEVAVVV